MESNGILVWAGITDYNQLDGLNSNHLFLIVLEAARSKIKVPLPADPASGRDLHPVCKWPFSPCIFPWWRTERESKLCYFSSYKGTNTIMRASPS